MLPYSFILPKIRLTCLASDWSAIRASLHGSTKCSYESSKSSPSLSSLKVKIIPMINMYSQKRESLTPSSSKKYININALLIRTHITPISGYQGHRVIHYFISHTISEQRPTYSSQAIWWHVTLILLSISTHCPAHI